MKLIPVKLFFPSLAAALLLAAFPLFAEEAKEAEEDGLVVRHTGAKGRIAQDTAPVLRIIEAEDQIIRIRAKTRHTTVIVLPATETVLDFVVGDSEYWHLTGAANLAFLKPIAEGVTTNVALVCESGKIYSFLVSESGAEDPHLVVRIAAQGDTDPRSPPAGHEPAFVARRQRWARPGRRR